MNCIGSATITVIMRFGPLETFRKFLNADAEKVSVKQVGSALAHTWRFYHQRRELSKRHYLRFYRLPQLYALQVKVDIANRRFLEMNRAKLVFYQKKAGLFGDKTEVRVEVPHRYEVLKANFPSPAFQPWSAIQTFWDEVHVREGKIDERVQGTAQNIVKYLKSLQYVDSAAKWLVKYLNLYHEALQQLIEGHREVTQDQETRLESGKTVKETLEEFEQGLREHMPQYQDLTALRDKFTKNDNKKE